MDIYLLDNNWQTLAIIDDFTSLIWRRKYYEAGDFELHCSSSLHSFIPDAAYVYRNDRNEIGVIEQLEIDNNTCIIKGRFAECLLSRYVIYPTKAYSNKTTAYICNALVGDFIDPVVLSQTNVDNTAISLQVTGENLMEYTYQQLKACEMSQSLTYDFYEKTFIYRVYRGLDRRQSQSVNSWAVFSPDWDNLQTLKYSKSTKDYRNYAIVAGQGEGSDRIVVTVDKTNGAQRRELWVDAKDLKQEEGMTDAEYREQLKQRGETKLAEYLPVEKCDATVDTLAGLEYMIDYDLGDLCTVGSRSLGIMLEQRITEIEEVYEDSSFSLTVQFGDGYLLVTDYLKRALK